MTISCRALGQDHHHHSWQAWESWSRIAPSNKTPWILLLPYHYCARVLTLASQLALYFVLHILLHSTLEDAHEPRS